VLLSSRVKVARLREYRGAGLFWWAGMKTEEIKQAPKTRKKCGQAGARPQKKRVSTLVEKALKSFEQRLDKEDLKLTTAEYLKLLQMEQELEQESPKEIKVTWVEPEKTSPDE